MKRLNKIAKRITAYDEAIEQFIKECEDSGKFNDEQMQQICWGFQDGLTIEEVEVYANPEFNGDQMETIEWGLVTGLSIEQVKVYAKPEISWRKMEEIRWEYRWGMSIDEVKEKYDL